MANEFARMNMQPQQQPLPPHPEQWSREFQQMHHHHPPPAAAMHGPMPHMAPPAQWAAEFAHQQQHAHAAHAPPPHVMEQVYEQALQGPAAWAEQFAQQHNAMPPTEQQNLESAFQDASNVTGQDWANEFDDQQAADSAQQEQANGGGALNGQLIEQLRNHPNPKFRNSKFVDFIDKLHQGRLVIENGGVVEATPPVQAAGWAAEFDHQQQPDQPDQGAAMMPPTEQAAAQAQEWAAELSTEEAFNNVLGSEEDQVLGEEWLQEFMQHENDQVQQSAMWQQFMAARDQAEQQGAVEPVGDPDYVFAENNRFDDAKDPMQVGIKLLREGDLKEAIQAFEAAVRKTPQEGEAWRYLGQANAEYEQESQAIAALLKAVEVDPYNLAALLMLGVSYTNDLEEVRALNYLKTWLSNHPDYQTPEMAEKQARLREYEQFYSSGSLDKTTHQEVANMFLEAVRQNPNDADLHTVLGVLYHITNDFPNAINAFESAVKLRPDDPYLWNKLGATKANAKRSDEAIGAYERALALKSNYVRAHANLAISFANLGQHEKAAQAYLSTLKLNPDADHLWSYLRISLAHMGRDHLVKLAQRRDVELFRQYFQF
jgi:peroxin-5